MRSEQGFTLVMAIFILVVASLLGAYMARLQGVQQMTAAYALQASRAYLFAKVGLDWATARLNQGGSCTDVNAQTALTFPDMLGFSVRLTCSSQTFNEGSKTPVIYHLHALSQFGGYDDPNYAARQLEVSVVLGG
jgi:MSHA biogenesis protein MshP